MRLSLGGVVLVPGTHSALRGDDQQEWWHPGSGFIAFLASQGLCLADREPFVWSTNLDGVRWFPWQWFKADTHRDWEAAGFALKRYLQTIPYEHRNVIAHSHGGQVALYALTAGAKIRRLLTVSTPVRSDMREVAQRARVLFDSAAVRGRWRHLYAPKGDRMQWLGGVEFFDRRWGAARTFDQAHENQPLPGDGHSRVLNEADWFPKLTEPFNGTSVIDFLKG